MTLQQLFDGIYTGAPLPSKPVVLTFDDGYSDAFTDAFPLLRKYSFGGSFAIVTGFVGQPGYVNWDQVKQMAGSQMEISRSELDSETNLFFISNEPSTILTLLITSSIV